MTKQEEIREGIEKKIKIGIDFGFSPTEITKEVIEYEDSQGVVIKADDPNMIPVAFRVAVEPLIGDNN